MAKNFASNFMPVFRASELARFCSIKTRKEKTELDFVIRYAPFSKFKSKLVPGQRFSSLRFTTHEDKSRIKKELQNEFNTSDSTKFDDKKVLDKLMQSNATSDDSCASSKDANNNDLDLAKYLREEFQKSNYSNSLLNQIRCERGRQLENKIIERINMQENMNFILDGTDRFKKFDSMYIIKGRVDGIDTQSNTLIEIKTRSKVDHTSNTMELRDRIQCLAYMKLTSYSSAFLVENDSNGELRLFRIEYDEIEFTNRIHLGLIHFVNKYRNISENEFLKLIYKYYK